MKISNVRRGADPELFLVDGYGQAVSSIGRIGGSKDKPLPFADGGFAVQEDNVAVEFNIPAASSREDFLHSLQFSVDYLEQLAAQQGLKLAIVPTIHFSKEQLANKQAQLMGCEPDFCVYTMSENPRPQAPKTLRSAGGHLHLSWDNPTEQEAEMLVIAHDLFCGCPSIKLDPDVERRSIYGKAGAFRYKKYGVEYRTPSNFWIKSKEAMDWMYTQSEKAVKFLNDGLFPEGNDFQKIQECINTSNEKLLHELNEKFSIV